MGIFLSRNERYQRRAQNVFVHVEGRKERSRGLNGEEMKGIANRCVLQEYLGMIFLDNADVDRASIAEFNDQADNSKPTQETPGGDYKSMTFEYENTIAAYS